jgi:hypothetical protein
VERQTPQDPPERGDPPPTDRAEALEKIERPLDALGGRLFEPLESIRVAPPGEDVEERARHVDSRDLRLAMFAQDVPRVQAGSPAQPAAPRAPRCSAELRGSTRPPADRA